MSCQYCVIFHNSKLREPFGRFCSVTQRMIPPHGNMCDKIELVTIFWCHKDGSQMDFRMCSARQSKGDPSCKHCPQKEAILKARRFAGRISAQKPKPVEKKVLLIRR